MPRTRTVMSMTLALLLMGTGVATAADGVLACVARYKEAANPDDTGANASIFLTNLNDRGTIVINEVLVYDAAGDLLCEGPAGWTDPPFPTVLGPNSGTWMSPYRLKARWGCPVPQVGWLILKFKWSSPDRRRIFPLSGKISGFRSDGLGVTLGVGTTKCETVKYSPR